MDSCTTDKNGTEDVGSTILHLPSRSREELSLVLAEATYRELETTLHHACGGPGDVKHPSGAATGQVGRVATSAISVTFLEAAIRILLASGHGDEDEAYRADLEDFSFVKDGDTPSVTLSAVTQSLFTHLDPESTMLLRSFILLRDLRRAMQRRDWDSTRDCVRRIDLFNSKRLNLQSHQISD